MRAESRTCLSSAAWLSGCLSSGTVVEEKCAAEDPMSERPTRSGKKALWPRVAGPLDKRSLAVTSLGRLG